MIALEAVGSSGGAILLFVEPRHFGKTYQYNCAPQSMPTYFEAMQKYTVFSGILSRYRNALYVIILCNVNNIYVYIYIYIYRNMIWDPKYIS